MGIKVKTSFAADRAAEEQRVLPLVPRGRQLGGDDRRALRHHGLLLAQRLQGRAGNQQS